MEKFDEDFVTGRNSFFTKQMNSSEAFSGLSDINNKTDSSQSSDRFHKMLTRKMSSNRRPLLDRPKADRNRKTEYEVEISFIFIRIGEIDTVHETFFAEAFMEAKWMDRSISGNVYDPERHWNPEIILENSIRGLSVKKSYTLKERENRRKGVTISEKWMIKGIFWKTLTLRNFPIDVQELSISLASLKPVNEIKFRQCQTKISAVIQEGFIDQQEWKLYSFLACKEVLVSHKFSADEYPSYLITAYTCRRPNYYYYNAFFLIFLISVSSLTTFSMPCDVPQSRLQTACTVLLTSITFKWIINRSMPTVYYLTSLDFYSLINIVLICMKCVWHASIGYFASHYVIVYNSSRTVNAPIRNGSLPIFLLDSNQCKDEYAIYDGAAFTCFVVFFILMNIGFLYWYFFKAKKEAKSLNEREKRFLDELRMHDDEKNIEKRNAKKYRYTSIYINKSLLKKNFSTDQETEVTASNNNLINTTYDNGKTLYKMMVNNTSNILNEQNYNTQNGKLLKRSSSHLALFNGAYNKDSHEDIPSESQNIQIQQPIFATLHDYKGTHNDLLTSSKNILTPQNSNIFTIQNTMQSELDV